MKKLPKELRDVLKEPFGDVIQADNAKPNCISIGDRTSFELITHGKIPRVVIRDNKEQRKKVPRKVEKTLDEFGDIVLIIDNPQGSISEEAQEIIKMALSVKGTVRIDVNGEEDLLTLIVIISSKIGDEIYYGQPNRGIVRVKINEGIKTKVKKILSRMEEIP